MGGKFVPPFLPPQPEGNATRGTDPKARGADDKAAQEQGWIEWSYNLWSNRDDFLKGVISGLVFGKPVFVDGVMTGRAAGLFPDKADEAYNRLTNAVAFGMGGVVLRGHYFIAAVFVGLGKEIEGIVKTIGSIVSGEIFTMIGSALDAIAMDPAVAFALGEQVGGGMVQKLFDAQESDDFDDFVWAVGELLGSLLLDLVTAFLTGGGATLAKVGARVSTKVARVSGEVLEQVVKHGGRHVDEFLGVFNDLARGPQPAYAYAYAYAGPPGRRMPGGPANGLFDNVMMSQSRGTGPGTRGLGGGSRAPASGGAKPGGPSGAPTPPPGSGINPAAAVTGGVAEGAVRRGGKVVRNAFVDAAAKSAWSFIVNARRGGYIPPVRKRDPGAAAPDPFSFPPRRGALLNMADEGLDLGHYDDLADILKFMNQSANAGAVRRTEATILDTMTRGEIFGPFETGKRVIHTYSSAIVQKAPKGTFPKYNGKYFWRSRYDAYKTKILPQLRELLKHTDRPQELLALLDIGWDVAHSYGKGAGDEIALGMGYAPNWVNKKVQAGGFSNKSMKVDSRRGARADHGVDPSLANPHKAELDGVKHRDEYGLEGFIIDFARTVKSASGKDKRFPKDTEVLLDTFTTSWGDELLESDMFRIARELGIDLKPQHFVSAVEYRARLVVRKGDAFVPLDGPKIAYRLDIAPPPFFERAKVTVLNDPFKLWSGTAASASPTR